MKGWGPKSSMWPSMPRKSNFLGGISRVFCWDIPGVPEKFEKKKVWVQFSFPKIVFGSCLKSCNALHDRKNDSEIYVFRVVLFWPELVL